MLHTKSVSRNSEQHFTRQTGSQAFPAPARPAQSRTQWNTEPCGAVFYKSMTQSAHETTFTKTNATQHTPFLQWLYKTSKSSSHCPDMYLKIEDSHRHCSDFLIPQQLGCDCKAKKIQTHENTTPPSIVTLNMWTMTIEQKACSMYIDVRCTKVLSSRTGSFSATLRQVFPSQKPTWTTNDCSSELSFRHGTGKNVKLHKGPQEKEAGGTWV